MNIQFQAKTLPLAIAYLVLCGLPGRAEEYKTAEDAFRAGARLHNQRDYRAAQAPLEAALALAPNDAYRLKVYNGLVASYRLLPEPEKMIEACEFVMLHTKSFPERSNVSRMLHSFLFNRGLADSQRQRYEAQAEKSPDDVVALSMLVAILSADRKERALAEPFQQRLREVERKQAGELAAESEAAAANSPAEATWHWKEAATRWIQADDKVKALAAANKATALGPDMRSDLLRHFWHRQIGEVYLNAGEFKLAVEQLQQAIDTTTIQGYKDECQKELEEAQAKLAGQ
ncbi:MAG: hypothetical protein AB7O62_16490 [Pirellulales bacterium]